MLTLSLALALNLLLNKAITQKAANEHLIRSLFLIIELPLENESTTLHTIRYLLHNEIPLPTGHNITATHPTHYPACHPTGICESHKQ